MRSAQVKVTKQQYVMALVELLHRQGVEILVGIAAGPEETDLSVMSVINAQLAEALPTTAYGKRRRAEFAQRIIDALDSLSDKDADDV